MVDIIDINKVLDIVKVKFYNEWLYANHLFDEGPSEDQSVLTDKVIEVFINPLNLDKSAHILDVGCGYGYFLDKMKEHGYTNLTGITLGHSDAKACRERGHTIKEYDMSFLPQTDGYYDESVDFIFARQSLNHSPYPLFTLMEYNRVLKQGSKIYIEVPAPNSDRKLELHPNNRSIFGEQMLVGLLERTGFTINSFQTFELTGTYTVDSDPNKTYNEKYFSIVVTKTRPLDVK
jgi:SAM-dependent methyltransferase